MTRRQIVLAACLVVIGVIMFALARPAYGAPTTISAESQAWWNESGIAVPSRTGEHIHMSAELPAGPVDGTFNLPVKVTLHNATGAVRWLRVCRESSNCQTWTVSLGPCADCSRDYVLPVKVGSWPSGKQEMRLTANISVNDEGKRQFQSTGWPIQVRSSTSCPRCAVFWTARGWYTGHGYANAEIESPILAVRPGASVNVYMHPGSDGKPTKFSGAYIDPDFHNGRSGIVLGQWSGQFRGSVTIPSLPAGPHKLVLVSSDGQNAGVMVRQFTAP